MNQHDFCLKDVTLINDFHETIFTDGHSCLLQWQRSHAAGRDPRDAAAELLLF